MQVNYRIPNKKLRQIRIPDILCISYRPWKIRITEYLPKSLLHAVLRKIQNSNSPPLTHIVFIIKCNIISTEAHHYI